MTVQEFKEAFRKGLELGVELIPTAFFGTSAEGKPCGCYVGTAYIGLLGSFGMALDSSVNAEWLNHFLSGRLHIPIEVVNNISSLFLKKTENKRCCDVDLVEEYLDSLDNYTWEKKQNVTI